MDHPSETSLCTVAPSPTDTPFPFFFFLRGGGGSVIFRLPRSFAVPFAPPPFPHLFRLETEGSERDRERPRTSENHANGAAVHRLSGTDNPSSNRPSKLTDKVRRIVHSKLTPFHFQIKTNYLPDADYQTDNPSHTDDPSLV